MEFESVAFIFIFLIVIDIENSEIKLWKIGQTNPSHAADAEGSVGLH